MTLLGAKVTRAASGAELIEQLGNEGPFDLVVTDISMPWMNGQRGAPLMPARARTVPEATVHVFPPALVPVLRERFASSAGSLADISDGVLIELLTTIFLAGLGTYEGEHHSIGVVFLGRSSTDVVIPEGTGVATYQWKIVRFETPRPFVIPELVKLIQLTLQYGLRPEGNRGGWDRANADRRNAR